MLLKKIYFELCAIRKELQALHKIEVLADEDVNVEISTFYSNNEPCSQVLEISLSYHNWCELIKKPFYQDLMEYLNSLKIQKNIDIQKEDNLRTSNIEVTLMCPDTYWGKLQELLNSVCEVTKDFPNMKIHIIFGK